MLRKVEVLEEWTLSNWILKDNKSLSKEKSRRIDLQIVKNLIGQGWLKIGQGEILVGRG